MSLVQSAGLVNSQNAHFSNPGFSSKVGAVTGCSGSGSDLALQQKGLYQVVKSGGKRMRRTRKSRKITGKKRGSKRSRGSNGSKRSRKMRGGIGHSFSQQQTLADRSGSGSGHSAHRGEHSTYEHNGINSDTNMNASSQAGQSGGNAFGEGGYPYYSYKPTDGENLSLFAGSGYPPISRGLNSQCGGKRKGRKSKKMKSKKGGKGKRSKRNRRKSGSKRQRGGYSQYMSNVANAHNYSTGAPPALAAGNSALANPPPYTPSNDCLNTWKHLGDTAPYNKIYN